MGKAGRSLGCRNAAAPRQFLPAPQKGRQFSRKQLCVHFRKADAGIKVGLPSSAKILVSHKNTAIDSQQNSRDALVSIWVAA